MFRSLFHQEKETIVALNHPEPGHVVDLDTYGDPDALSTVVAREKQFEAIRFTLRPDRSLPPHKVDGPITVHCLSGRCTFFVDDEPRQLSPGSWLYLRGGTVHALQAEEASVLMVTIMFVGQGLP